MLTTTKNAAKNGVSVRFFTPDAFHAESSDIVVANILANPLIVLAPLITAQCAGQVALSGVLESQASEVASAYAPQFELSTTDREEGWVLLAGSRR